MNGIYDLSDTTRALYEHKLERDKVVERNRKLQADTLNVGMNALKYWDLSQKGKAAEMLAMKTPGNERSIYEWDPDYINKGMLKKLFTPGAGKVRETAEGSAYLAQDKAVAESLKAPKTFGDQLVKTGEDVASASEKTFGSTAGKIASGIGTFASAADLVTNWDDKSDLDKVLGTATTTLGALSTFVNPAYGLWAAGSSLLDAVFS